jgi:hypothetical protein
MIAEDQTTYASAEAETAGRRVGISRSVVSQFDLSLGPVLYSRLAAKLDRPGNAGTLSA